MPTSANEAKKITHLWCLRCWESLGAAFKWEPSFLPPGTLCPFTWAWLWSQIHRHAGGWAMQQSHQERLAPEKCRLKSGGQSTSPSTLPFSQLQLCCFHWGCQITQIPVALCYALTVALGDQDEPFPGKAASPLSTGSDGMWSLKSSQQGEAGQTG